MKVAIAERQRIYFETIDEASRQPFEYGANDCMLLIGKAVQRLIGVDYMREFVPYNINRAVRIIHDAGGYVGLVSRFLGLPEDSLDGIRVCDPVIVRGEQTTAGGLWGGSHPTVLGGEGVRPIDASLVIASWRVG